MKSGQRQKRWECIESKKVFEAREGDTVYMELYQDRVRTNSGSVISYARYNSSDVVLVVPFLGRDRLVMIRQYRYPLDKVMLEFPAGHIEKGEDAADAAGRELEEETGYRAKKLDYLYRYHPSVSKSRQTVHVFRASGLEQGRTNHDSTETIDVEIVGVAQLRRMVEQNRVENAGTLISYLLCCSGIKVAEKKEKGGGRRGRAATKRRDSHA